MVEEVEGFGADLGIYAVEYEDLKALFFVLEAFENEREVVVGNAAVFYDERVDGVLGPCALYILF